MKKIKIIICMIAILFSSTAVSYARATIKNLAQVEKLFMEGKYDKVVAAADKLIDERAYGREELFYLKGLSQTKLTGFKDARETLQYMIEKYPRGKRPFDGYIGIGDAYLLEGKSAEAITAYNKALQSYPDNKNAPMAYYKIGTAYQKLGNQNKAKEYFDKAKSAAPLSFESKMIEKLPEETAVSSAPPGAFYVQVGYFKSKNNAERLNYKLHKKGYDSYIGTEMKSASAFYRVKVGCFNTRSDAESMALKLKNDGYKTKICP